MRALTTAFGITLCAALAVPPASAQEAEVRAAITESLSAWTSGDVEGFGRFFTADARGFNLDGGVLIQGYNAVALRAALAAGFAFTVRPSNIDVKVYGDAAVASAYLVGSITLPGGATQEGTWRYTETRVRQDGTWKIVQYHVSPYTAQTGGRR